MHLRAHYVLMSDVWTELANHPEAEQPLPHEMSGRTAG